MSVGGLTAAWGLKAMGAVACVMLVAACGSTPGPNGPRGSVGGRYDQAVAYKDAGECVRAIPLFEALARRGRGWELAQVHLADCLIDGGRMEEAAQWLTRAAESNEPRAQARLALLYFHGRGVAHDRAEAAKWYLLATRRSLDSFVAESEFPDGFRALMASELTAEDLAAGQERVAAWIPTYEEVNTELVRKGLRDSKRAQEEAKRRELERIRREQDAARRRSRW